MKKIFLLIIVAFSFITATDVYANPYNHTFKFNGQDKVNCTWYAWDQASRKAGVSLPSWGNASTWYESARRAGFEVGQTPRSKSIVVWSWYNSSGKNLGHVGYVERVQGNKIYVWDSDSSCVDYEYPPFKECLANSVDQTTEEACYRDAKKIACEEDASYWSTPGDLIGYIYLDNVPKIETTKKTKKTTVATEKKTTVATTTTTTVEIKKPYLKNIDTSVGKLNFDKEKYEYEINTNKGDNFIIIAATPEDEEAKIEGDGRFELVKGRNEYKIRVFYDNGEENTYTLVVNNSEENVVISTSYERNINYPIPLDIIFGVVVGITIFIFSYGIYRRKC